MRTLTLLFAASLTMAGCSSNKELSREEALKLIKEGERYPKVIDYDLYLSDPEFAKKAIYAGLEDQGLLTVQRTQKLADIGNPLIGFTDKAKPYLLPTSDEDKMMDIQKVKIADQDLVEVTNIQTMEDGKQAIAEYKTAYKNINGFSALTKTNYKKSANHKAYFMLYDDGWRLEKKR
jgi:hypothetical protein